MKNETESQLTVEDYEAITKEAFQNWKKHFFRLKGQTVMHEDDIEWHVMRATEKYLAEKANQ